MTTLVPGLRRELDPESLVASLYAPRGAVRRSGARDRADRLSLAGIDLDREAVVQGLVTRGGSPAARVRVRLLDDRGAFVAEVPTSSDGSFRFFAAPGAWTVVLVDMHESVPAPVLARRGAVVELQLAV